jgi:hypothetical protein
MGGDVRAYVGLMEAIFFPSDDGTHSLLMKSPVGWIYVRPFGAVSWTCKSVILFFYEYVCRGDAGLLRMEKE